MLNQICLIVLIRCTKNIKNKRESKPQKVFINEHWTNL